MKVILLSASPRKENSQTFLLACEVLKGCNNKEAQTEIIHLADYTIKFCQACGCCHKKILDCPLQDDVLKILNKLLEADGIILASPNYLNQITASLKALMERASTFIHCLRLEGKYIAGVVSSGSGRDKAVLNYIKEYANSCGAQYSGGISAQAPVILKKKQEARQLGKKLRADIIERRKYPLQLKNIEQHKQYFKWVIKRRKKEWKEEYEYWQEKGWL
ncbi:MAG: flavodoxin family protein [Candidatus Sumerlaeia bacterium]|nr:flavodoxin family protein [Candidatus Sumerlaeia bacterium]